MFYAFWGNQIHDFFSLFFSDAPSVGTKLEGLLLDELDDDFNPRAFEISQPAFNNISNNNGAPPLCKCLLLLKNNNRAVILFSCFVIFIGH